MQTRTLAAALLSAAVPALAAAGCGGAGAAADGTTVDRQAAALKYVRCLRAHGVKADVDANGGIGVRVGAPGSSGGSEKKTLSPPPEMRKADEACKKYREQSMGTPEERAKMQQQALESALKFARCMRAHGISWPDPKTSGDGLIQAGPTNVNPNSPAMQKAMKACQGKLPLFRAAKP